MNDGLREVRLLGALGTKFGERHHFLISSPAEAVRALAATCPGFERELVESKADLVQYQVLVDDEVLERPEESIYLPSGRSRITIAPVIIGAGGMFGGGGGGILMGAALIALSFVPGVNVAVWAGSSVMWSTVAFSMGVSMVLGGIASMLSSTPDSPSPTTNEPAANKPSYVFNGPVNTTRQGHPVPVLYGRAIVGGGVGSAGLLTVDT